MAAAIGVPPFFYPFNIDPLDDLDRRWVIYRYIGYIYIMRNTAFKDPLLKIGKTKRHPSQRTEELTGSTGVPKEFELVYYVHVNNIDSAEMTAHQMLDEKRYTRNREFFNVSIKEAVQVLDTVAENYPIMKRKSLITLPQQLQPVIIKCPECNTENRVKKLLIEVKHKCGKCGKTLENK